MASGLTQDALEAFLEAFSAALRRASPLSSPTGEEAAGDDAPAPGRFANLVLAFVFPQGSASAVEMRPGTSAGERRGLGMFAIRDVCAGEIVFACRAAHVSIYASGRKRVCAACFGTQKRPLRLRCSACDAVYYCSSACVSRHRDTHAASCELLPALWKYDLNKKGRGSKGLDRVSHEMFQGLTLLLLALRGMSDPSALEELQEESASWSDVLRPEFEAVCKSTVNFLRERAGVQAEQVEAEQWLSRMHHNTFDLGRQFGELMFDTMSFFNHACEPIVETVPVDDCQYLFAARDIVAGEEVFTHYIDVDQPIQQRRKQLQQSFGFLCECTRCCVEACPSHRKGRKQQRKSART